MVYSIDTCLCLQFFRMPRSRSTDKSVQQDVYSLTRRTNTHQPIQAQPGPSSRQSSELKSRGLLYKQIEDVRRRRHTQTLAKSNGKSAGTKATVAQSKSKMIKPGNKSVRKKAKVKGVKLITRKSRSRTVGQKAKIAQHKLLACKSRNKSVGHKAKVTRHKHQGQSLHVRDTSSDEVDSLSGSDSDCAPPIKKRRTCNRSK